MSNRPPRDSVERARRYDLKLVPADVGDVLEARLPDMRTSFGTWADYQARLTAVMAGVLSGFAVPSHRYARYYSFGFHVDSLRRKFGSALTAIAEASLAEAVWIGRGLDVVILAAIKTAVTSYETVLSYDVTDYPDWLAINTQDGRLAYSAVTEKHIWVRDQRTLAEHQIHTVTDFPNMLAWCPELDTVVGFESDYLTGFRVLADGTTVTEQAFTAGDNIYDVCVDYDPANFTPPDLGYAVFACKGAARLRIMPLNGTVVITSVVLPHPVCSVILDRANNRYIALAEGFADLYYIDRNTKAVLTKTLTHRGSDIALDAIHNEVWIANLGGTHKLQRWNMSANTCTVYTTTGEGPIFGVDYIRGDCYLWSPAAGLLEVQNRDGTPLRSSVISTDTNIGAVSPEGCFTVTGNGVSGVLTIRHCISGNTRALQMPDPCWAVAIDPKTFRTWVSSIVPGTSWHLNLVYP